MVASLEVIPKDAHEFAALQRKKPRPVSNAYGSKMKKSNVLRHIATALVLASLALPLSRCQKVVIQKPSESSAPIVTEVPGSFKYTYPHDWFELSEWTGWIALFAFTWPALILLARYRSRRIRESTAFTCLEILLSLGGGYVVWLLSDFGERFIGFYVAITGMAIYFLASSVDLFELAVSRYVRNRNEPPLEERTSK